MSRRIQAFYATETGDQGHDRRNNRMLNYYSYSRCQGHNFYGPQYRSYVGLRLQSTQLFRPWGWCRMHKTGMSLFLLVWKKCNVYCRDPNYTLHGLGYLLPSLSSNMAQQRMTIEAASVTFSNRKQPQHSTTVTPWQPSAQYSNAPACPLRPQHTHIKANMKIWARKSYSTKIQIELYSRRQSASVLLQEYQPCKLTVHSYWSKAVLTEKCFQYYKCLQ